MTYEEFQTRVDRATGYQKTSIRESLRTLYLLPNAPFVPTATEASFWTGSVEFTIPYGMENFAQARRELGLGWKRVEQYTPGKHRDYYSWYYSKKDSLNVVMRMYIPDSDEPIPGTCRRVKTGEKWQKVPQYEIICD